MALDPNEKNKTRILIYDVGGQTWEEAKVERTILMQTTDGLTEKVLVADMEIQGITLRIMSPILPIKNHTTFISTGTKLTMEEVPLWAAQLYLTDIGLPSMTMGFSLQTLCSVKSIVSINALSENDDCLPITFA